MQVANKHRKKKKKKKKKNKLVANIATMHIENGNLLQMEKKLLFGSIIL
jgi:hypothetical protein